MLPVVAPVVALVGLQLLHNWTHPMPGLPSPVIGTWNPANAWQSQFDGPDGHLEYVGPMAFFFLVRPLLSPGIVGLLLLPFVVLGAVGLRWHVARWNVGTFYAPAALLLGWWLLFAGFYSGNVYQADRFVLSYMTPMAVLAGMGVRFWILDFGFWIGRNRSKIQNPKSKIGWVVVLGAVGPCLVGLAALASTARADFRAVYAGKEDYMRAVGCMGEVVGGVSGKPVFSFGVTFALREYTDAEPRDLYYETPESIDEALKGQSEGVRGYLVLPVQGFEEQWGNTEMGATYRHLQEAYRLEERRCEGSSFSVYEVGK